jgi:hypothetical protein
MYLLCHLLYLHLLNHQERCLYCLYHYHLHHHLRKLLVNLKLNLQNRFLHFLLGQMVDFLLVEKHYLLWHQLHLHLHLSNLLDLHHFLLDFLEVDLLVVCFLKHQNMLFLLLLLILR